MTPPDERVFNARTAVHVKKWWLPIVAGQSDLLGALLHSDCAGPYSGWSAGIPFRHAIGWRGDQGGHDVICNTLDTQTRAPDQQALQVTGQSPQY